MGLLVEDFEAGSPDVEAFFALSVGDEDFVVGEDRDARRMYVRDQDGCTMLETDEDHRAHFDRWLCQRLSRR